MTTDARTQLAIRLTPGILTRVDHYANGVMTRSAAVRELLGQALAAPAKPGSACPRCAGLKDWQLAARAAGERTYSPAEIARAFSRADGEMPFLCAEEVLDLLESR